MADRVFPNNSEVNMGSKLTFNTIDWGDVESNIKNNNKFADDQTNKIKELLKLSESSCHDDDSEDEKEAEKDEACNSSTEEFVLEEKTAKTNTTMKKIAFTHPSQISAEAIEKAQQEGNTELVNTILAARKANRMRIAKAIEGKLQKQSQTSQLSEKSLNKVAEIQGKSTSVDQFVSPTQFTQAQRNSFEKTAMALGFPKEYVQAMCSKELPTEVVQLNNDIKSIYASGASENAKISAVTKLVKEAGLSPESKKEFIDYWNNILGYQDKEFWGLVAKDYTENEKVK